MAVNRDIVMIDRFPDDEKAILIRTCPVIMAQIMLRDKRIRELESQVKGLEGRVREVEPEMLFVQETLLELPGD